MEAYFIYNRRVGNFLPAVLGDVFIVYDTEVIDAADYFSSTIHTSSDALAEASISLEYD